MKKHVFILLFLIATFVSVGQITGTKFIPGDYPSVEVAISALNYHNAGPGGVTFLVAAGHTETFTSPLAGLITATGSADNPIVFLKSGTGSDPVITAATPGTGSMDFILCFSGSDFITFDGISLRENLANTTPTSQMEWGLAVLKASADNGSQYNTIRNVSINLNSANSASFALYSANHTPYSTDELSVSSPDGTNSFNKFYNLNIENAYNAIQLSGENDEAPYTFYDYGNEIGTEGYVHVDGLGGSQGTATAYGIRCRHQDELKIANASFCGNVSNSTGPLYVIHLSSGNNSSAEIYNNTISMSYHGTGSFYGIYNAGFGSAGTSNEVKIHDNNIINNSIPNFSSSTLAYVYLSAGSVSAQLFNNTITGNVAGSMTANATGTLYYIYFNNNPYVPGTCSIYQNTISGNSRIQASPAGGVTYGLYTAGNGNLLNVMDNDISNIDIASLGTTFIMYNLFSGIKKNIHHNLVSGIHQARGTVYCYYNGNGSGAGYHYANRIQDINMTSGSGRLYGIYHSSGANQFYYNNFISELNTPFANSNPAIYGIYLGGTSSTGAYNNTIYLDASSSGPSFGVTGIYASTVPEVELINNLVVNSSIPGPAGRVVAYQRSSPNLSNYSLLSNNNCFYAGTPGTSHLIYYDGSNADQSLATYKNRVSPREASSVIEKPPFINISATPYDLHIANDTPTQCEGGGSIIESPLMIQDDFDGDVRFPGEGYPANVDVPVNSTDIGADEFAGVLNDQTPPGFSFKPLTNTSGILDRELIVSITDATGVPFSGPGLPVLYWRINNNSYTAASATWLSGHSYSFTFGGGVALGDVVSYYIVARDTTGPDPNIGAFPINGADQFSHDPPMCAIPPSTPYSYIIIDSLSGVYPVGAGQVYPTLSDAISDLNMKELTAPVIFELWDTLYSSMETFPLVIHACAGMSTENTLTIKPKTGVDAKVKGSSPTGIISLYGASNVFLDGSNDSVPGRHLTFENVGTGANSFVIGLFHNGQDAAVNNEISHCILKAGSRTNNTSGVKLNEQGGGYDHLTINDNLILNATTGILFTGTTIRGSKYGRITNNTLGSDNSSLTLGNTGIAVSNADGLIISGNRIQNLFTNINPKGIVVGTNTMNASITGNTITGVKYAGTSGYGGVGIDVNTGHDGCNLVLANNVISDISGDGSYDFGSNAISGIRLLGTSGGISLWFNTVNLEGNLYRQEAIADVSASLYIAATVTDLDIRNNILKNSLENVSGNAGAYAVYSDAAPSSFIKLNYNDYYVSGAEGRLGFFNNEDIITMDEWKSATSKDMNSLSLDPMFISAMEPVPSNPGLENSGEFLASFPRDMAGLLRTSPPDPGAFEFGSNPAVMSLDASDVSCEGARLQALIDPNDFSGELYFDYGSDTAYGYTVPAEPAIFSGSDTILVSRDLALPAGQNYHYRIRVQTDLGVTVFGEDMAFSTPDPGVPAVNTQPAGEIGSYQAVLYAEVAAGCYPSHVFFEYGLTTDYGHVLETMQDTVDGGLPSSISAQLTGLESNTAYHFRCIALNEAGTTYGADEVFTTLLPPPPEAGTISGPAGACQASAGHVFSIDPLDFAEQYVWIIPPGAEITDGESTESITVSFSDTAASGYISVYGTGEGGNGNPSQLFVSVHARPEPVLNGAATCCVMSVYTYSTDTAMTAYEWFLSPGGEVLSGEGTPSVTVSWNSEGAQWISVGCTNAEGCESSAPTVLEVTVSDLPVPSISGSEVICENDVIHVYSTQPGYSDYLWEISSGGDIVSGQGTEQIEVSWEESGEHMVSVNYSNSSDCFAITPAELAVSVLQEPGMPGQITGTGKICANSYGIEYSVEPVPGAVTYEWTLPFGVFILEGEGTNNIQVVFTMVAQSGPISVMAVNMCGAGQQGPPFMVDVTPMPPYPDVYLTDEFLLYSTVEEGNQWYHDNVLIEGATDQFYQPEAGGFYWTIVTQNGCQSIESNHVEVILTGLNENDGMDFTVYPVPNAGQFTIRFNNLKEEPVSVYVFNSLGIKVFEERNIRVKENTQLSVDLRNPPSGIYTTILKWRDQDIIRKILVVQ